jgi:hypothetical protein
MSAVLNSLDAMQMGPGPVSRVAPAAASAGMLRQNLARSPVAGAQPLPAGYVSMGELLAGAEGSDADKAMVADSLRAMGAVSGTVLESGADNMHTLDVAGVRITLKLARAYAPGDAVILALGSSASTDTPELELSPAAKLLAGLLARTGTSPGVDAATPLAGTPLDTAQLATRLEQSLRQSGVFYESHLAAWVQGRTALADLRREPQGRYAAPAEGGSDAPGEAIPDALSGLVNRQLDVLENGAVRWTGQAWAGQNAEILIEDDSHAQAQSREDGAQRTWRIKLKLSMPGLGPVDAQIALSGAQVRITLSAAPGASERLAAAGGTLTSALAARGLSAQAITVNADG